MELVADGGERQEVALQREASARAVRELLTELPFERDRQLLTRHYLNEEDKEVICRDLGIPESAFNVALCRARQRFREILEKHDMTYASLVGAAPA